MKQNFINGVSGVFYNGVSGVFYNGVCRNVCSLACAFLEEGLKKWWIVGI